MQYKTVNDKIVCYRTGKQTVYAPDTQVYVDDETIPWRETERTIVRLPDFTFVYDDDPRVLEAKKIIKASEMECAFDDRVAGSITTSQGYVMQFNVDDSLKMQGALTLMETTEATEGYLTQADDTTVYHVPIATMKAVLVEMLAAYAACHARKQELRAAINAAQTEEALAAIQITWPV